MDKQEWQRCIEALNGFYQAIDQGQYEEAYEMLSERDKNHLSIEQFLAAREGDYHPNHWKLTPLHGTRKTVRDGTETKELRVAYVQVEFPPTSKFTGQMILENGQWKLYQNAGGNEKILFEVADTDDIDRSEARRIL